MGNMNTAPKLTLKEQFLEYQYRIDERLGILCEDRPPTPQQFAIAEREANQWQADYLRIVPKKTQLTMKL